MDPLSVLPHASCEWDLWNSTVGQCIGYPNHLKWIQSPKWYTFFFFCAKEFITGMFGIWILDWKGYPFASKKDFDFLCDVTKFFGWMVFGVPNPSSLIKSHDGAFSTHYPNIGWEIPFKYFLIQPNKVWVNHMHIDW